jgi:hypothetical protein
MDERLYKSSDGTPVHAIKAAGTDTLQIVAKITLDQDTAVNYKVAVCEVPSNFVIVGGSLEMDGAATGNVDLGLFETEEHGDTEIDGDMFIDNQDVTTAGSTSVLSNVALADQDKTIYELANKVATFDYGSASRQAFVLGLTVKTMIQAADSVSILRVNLARKS